MSTFYSLLFQFQLFLILCSVLHYYHHCNSFPLEHVINFISFCGENCIYSLKLAKNDRTEFIFHSFDVLCFVPLHSFQSILSLARKWRESCELSMWMATWKLLHGTRPNLFLVENILVPLNSIMTSLDTPYFMKFSFIHRWPFDLSLSVPLYPK